jgi:hypothetical protein
MSDVADEPNEDTVQARNCRVLRRGSEVGQVLLETLGQHKPNTPEALAGIAWAAAWIMHHAPDEDAAHNHDGGVDAQHVHLPDVLRGHGPGRRGTGAPALSSVSQDEVA